MADQAIALLPDQAHKTRVEAFLAKKGRIVIKIFHSLGAVQGLYGASLNVSTLRLFEPGDEQNCTEGIRIELTDGNDPPREDTTFLDMDEVESMVQGLQYMIGMIAQWQSPRQGDYTEVVFCTRSDLNAGFYVDQRKLQAFIKSAYFSVFIQPGSLRLLSDLMISGQSHLRGNPIFERV